MVRRSTRTQPAPRRRLSDGECHEWLNSHREGRLAYQTGRGPRSVVVSYALSGESVMFKLPDYNDIVRYAPGERVTLEVEGVDETAGDFETVTVTGQAQLVTGRAEQGEPVAHFQEQWPDGVPTKVISLPLTEVEGKVGCWS